MPPARQIRTALHHDGIREGEVGSRGAVVQAGAGLNRNRGRCRPAAVQDVVVIGIEETPTRDGHCTKLVGRAGRIQHEILRSGFGERIRPSKQTAIGQCGSRRVLDGSAAGS